MTEFFDEESTKESTAQLVLGLLKASLPLDAKIASSIVSLLPKGALRGALKEPLSKEALSIEDPPINSSKAAKEFTVNAGGSFCPSKHQDQSKSDRGMDCAGNVCRSDRGMDGAGDSCKSSKQQDQSLLAWASLTALLRRTLSLDQKVLTSNVEILRSKNGKPELGIVDKNGKPVLGFELKNSETQCGLANKNNKPEPELGFLNGSHELGIGISHTTHCDACHTAASLGFGTKTVACDIERIARFNKPPKSFLKRFPNKRSAALIDLLPPCDKAEALCILWTAAESRAKAIGTGIGREALSIDLTEVLETAIKTDAISVNAISASNASCSSRKRYSL